MPRSPAPFFLLLALLAFTAAAASSHEVDLTLEPGQAEYVHFVAFQDGTQPWRVATHGRDGYTFEVTDAAGRFGLAVVCQNRTTTGPMVLELRVLQATAAEITAVTLPCQGAPAPTERTAVLTGSVSNVAGGFEQLEVLTGGSSGRTSALDDYAFALSGLSPGAHDVLVVGLDQGQRLQHLAVRHGVEVEGSGHTTIDFSTGAAPAEFGLTVQGAVPGRPTSVMTFLRTKNGASALLSDAFAVPTSHTFAATFRAVPAHVLGAGDMHYLHVATTDELGQYLGADRIFHEGEELVLSLPAGHLSPAAADVLPGSYPRYGVTWADVGAAVISGKFSYTAPGATTEWHVSVTDGWLSEDVYHLPDLSQLDGWKPEWNAAAEDVTYASAELSAMFSPVATALNFIHERRAGENRYIRASVRFGR